MQTTNSNDCANLFQLADICRSIYFKFVIKPKNLDNTDFMNIYLSKKYK